MRRFFIVIFLLVSSFAGRAQEQERYTNPVLHMDYSDPDVCTAPDGFWMTASSFNCFPGLPILHSNDLVHWTLVGSALIDYEAPLKPGEGVWAPAIRYLDGWFYIFVGDPDRGIFMVRTKDPRGRWEAPVWLVRGKGFIDPCPLWDDDGRAWLSHALAGSRAGLKSVILLAPMSPDGTSLTGPSRIIYDGHDTQPTIEGTKFYKRDGMYYIFAPAGGVATGWQTVLRSSRPDGPWEERIVLAEAGTEINGPHQGAWVHTAADEDWFIHFQDKGAYGRIVHLQPMKWTADGWPVIGEDTGKGYGKPVSQHTAPAYTSGSPAAIGNPTTASSPSTIVNPSTSGSPAAASPSNPDKVYGCDWSATPYGLPHEWQYPAVPLPFWHYALPDGGVRLYSVLQSPDSRNLWDCPNLLQQKFPAERSSITAKLTFRHNPRTSETAGFTVSGEDYAGLRLTASENGATLEWILCIDAGKGSSEQCSKLAALKWTRSPQRFPLESRSVPSVKYPDKLETTVFVKLEVEPRAVKGNVPDAICRFSYSLNGKRYIPAGQPFTAVPGRWTGAKWGFFCNRTAACNDGGWLDVEDLEVRTQ